MTTLGERMKEQRRIKHIAQNELAKVIGLGQATIGTWEIGTREPSISSLVKMAQYFGVSVGYLIGAEDIDGMNFGVSQEDMIEVSPFEKEVLLKYRILPPSEQIMICRMLQLEHPVETMRQSAKKA